MAVSMKTPESKFAYVVVAGKRARQLMLGAFPLIAHPHSLKATRIAMEELNAGQLEYRTPEPPGSAAAKDKPAKE